MQTIRLGGVYFLVVFLSGFVINAIRTYEVLPQIGFRAAALIEASIMFCVIIVSASVIVHSTSQSLRGRDWLMIGCFGLVLLLGAAWILDFGPTGIRPIEYIAARDLTTKFLFVGGLIFFTVAPCLVDRMGPRIPRKTHDTTVES